MNQANVKHVYLAANKLLFLLMIIAALLLVSSCGVITEKQCRYGDFTEIGFNDANMGRMRNHFSKYHEKCLTYNIDLADEIVLYDLGRERAMMSYCNNVKYSSQCDRGSGDANIKSYMHINAEMLRLRSGLPQVSTGISR